MYTLYNYNETKFDLGFVDLKSSRPGPRKVNWKAVEKRRAKNKAARQSRRKNG
jgi:hypothetical protein